MFLPVIRSIVDSEFYSRGNLLQGPDVDFVGVLISSNFHIGSMSESVIYAAPPTVRVGWVCIYDNREEAKLSECRLGVNVRPHVC